MAFISKGCLGVLGGGGGGGVIARAVTFRQDFLFVSRVFVANVC